MIRLQGVSKRFGDVHTIQEVSLAVARGEAVALSGPSGSGKTTLLRLIAGLEVPDAGEIHLDGRLASRAGWACPPYQRGVGLVFQRPALWPHMTVTQNIAFGLSGFPKEEAKERLQETVRLTRLEGLERRYPDQISGGEAQRAALARAIAPRPPILLLDEPMGGLDPELNRQMIDLLLAIRRETRPTIVYVSHDAAEAAAVTDRLVRLHYGRLQESIGRGTLCGLPTEGSDAT